MNISQWFDRFVHRIEVFVSYIPILWGDHDWDYQYLMNLLAHKLKRMEKHHRTYKVIADWERVADEIHICTLLLNRLEKDEYLPTKKKYTKYDFDYDDYMHKQDMNYLFKIIARKSRTWWD